MSERITFSGGQTENVYCVPQFMLADLETLPEYREVPADSPEVAEAKSEALAQAKERAGLLLAFQDTRVPKGWQFPKSALAEGLEPASGDDGRRYDHIRYGLLVTSRDIQAAQRIMWGLTNEEVRAAEATFCGRNHCAFRRRRA